VEIQTDLQRWYHQKGAGNIPFIVTGQTKTEVEDRISVILTGLEKQKRFDHLVDIRKTPHEWKGTLQVFFHK